ncbi:MAG: hypothetical protein RBS07_17300 [Lentimicrobium sp.]|nr:hypothetical protein [Lentimicrobium sp.]
MKRIIRNPLPVRLPSSIGPALLHNTKTGDLQKLIAIRQMVV